MEELVGKKPHGTFEEYVNEELKEMIVTKTNSYVAQKNTNSAFTVRDLETFIAVLNLTGYHSLPRTRMFWEKEEAIGLSIVYVSVKEFEDIKRYINFADNNQLDTKDKFAKARKPYNIMNKNQQQFNLFHFYYSVDEIMVPYTGKKQQQTKIFGYKVLSCAPRMVIHIVVPNTVGRIKHLRIFVLALLSIVHSKQMIRVIRKYSLTIGFPPYFL